MAAGALGFATSRSPNHQGERGRPIPSRAAEFEEILALAEAVGDAGRGVIQTAYPGIGWDEYATLIERTGRPVSWTGIAAAAYAKDRGRAANHLGKAKALGDAAWPQFQIRPVVFQANMLDPAVLSYLPTFKEVLALPREQRADLYRDEAWRDRARVEVMKVWDGRWHKVAIQETVVHSDLVGVPLAELAEKRGASPFDVMIDLSLDEQLQTRFRCVLANDDDEEMLLLLRERSVLLGGHDGGAHASQMCDCVFPTYLLGHWVRDRGALTLEEAIWKVTAQPAEVFGIDDRGLLKPGLAADIMAFDPDRVAAEELVRVYDLPAGADRLVGGSVGMEHVWVNGVAIRTDGTDVDFSARPDARPGVVIRPGRGGA
jgi:N-acyl-D-aspartate/D-glutamate deacylase